MKKYFILIVLIFSFESILAQNASYLESTKIDPTFKQLFYNELVALDKGIPLQDLLIETENEVYSAFIYLSDYTQIPSNLRNTVLNEFVTIRGTKAQLLALLIEDNFDFLEISKKVELHNDASRAYTGIDALQAGYLNNKAYKGAGVLIGIIDSGLDFFHNDFRNPIDSTTRVVAMWDQNLTKIVGEEEPEEIDIDLLGLNYGVEYSRAQLNDELDGSPANFVRNPNLTDHGTHVAGTAAGNGNAYFGKHVGMAPEAELLIVNTDFRNSSLVDALRWMKRKADLAGKPIVVNMSLGSQFSSHDGKGQVSSAIDTYIGPGFIVVASAGNNGSAIIHGAKRILDNSSDSISIVIEPYAATNIPGVDFLNHLAYASSNENVTITVVTPNGERYSATSNSFPAYNTTSGRISFINFVDNLNNNRYFTVALGRTVGTPSPVEGTWKFVYENLPGGNPYIDIHLWRTAYSFNSTIVGGDALFSVAQPANSDNAISVGAYSQHKTYTRHNNVVSFVFDSIYYRSSFSSMGPNRDTVTIHPIIMAPGQLTVSAEIASIGESIETVAGSNSQHRSMSGTSMSSPVVAGLIALLLEQDPTLTTNQVKALLRDNATIRPFMGSIPNSTYGWGYLNGFQSMADLINPTAINNEHKTHIAADLTEAFPTSESMFPNGGFAVQFTPSSNGTLNGFLVNTGGVVTLTDSVNFRLFTSVGGQPGTQVGSTISIPPSKFSRLNQTAITLIGSSFLKTGNAPYNTEIILNPESDANSRIQAYTVDANSPYFLILEPQNGADGFSLYRDASNSGGSLTLSSGNWVPASGDFLFFANTSSSDFAPLPISNFNFTAKKVDQNALLSWKVGGVDALEELILEHKGNFDPEFKTLDKYTGSAAMENAFLHQRPGSGDQFYRLKAVEKGVLGSTYSTTKLVRFDIELSIYPNPSSNGTLNLELPAETAYNIKVSSLDGKTVYQTSSVGSRPFHLNFLPTGIYLVEIGNESFKTHYKWMLSK